jgi:hypothetical protein
MKEQTEQFQSELLCLKKIRLALRMAQEHGAKERAMAAIMEDIGPNVWREVNYWVDDTAEKIIISLPGHYRIEAELTGYCVAYRVHKGWCNRQYGCFDNFADAAIYADKKIQRALRQNKITATERKSISHLKQLLVRMFSRG